MKNKWVTQNHIRIISQWLLFQWLEARTGKLIIFPDSTVNLPYKKKIVRSQKLFLLLTSVMYVLYFLFVNTPGKCFNEYFKTKRDFLNMPVLMHIEFPLSDTHFNWISLFFNFCCIPHDNFKLTSPGNCQIENTKKKSIVYSYLFELVFFNWSEHEKCI